jgi:lycopene cyclase domain-containing protein
MSDGMSYLGFLGLYVVVPLALLTGLTLIDLRRRTALPWALTGSAAWLALVLHAAAALLYTTPWDNFLVANRVWWYDGELVLGVTLGYVPLEEYCFFVLQTVLTGLWLLYLARRVPVQGFFHGQGRTIRLGSTLTAGALWCVSAATFLSGWRPGTYLALELSWALPAIMAQLAFGADILWHHRRLLAVALFPATIYLSLADSQAIVAGTWTISPAKSVNVYLGGVLPLEEFIFFLLTNTLVIFGMILLLSQESQARLPDAVKHHIPLLFRGSPTRNG